MTKKIVIDPGHGGHDTGAVGFGLQEKNITLDIALRLRSLLANYSDVTLTRDSDVFISLSDRAAIANKLGADLFVSIHVNAGGGTGFESFIYNSALAQTELIREKIHKLIAAFYASQGLSDRGMKRANFAVLRQTVMPSVLLENLFIDNQKDASKLNDAGFRKGIAATVSDSIVKALNLPATGSKPSTEPAQPGDFDQPDRPGSNQPSWGSENFNRLLEVGLVFNQHDLNQPVTWAEMSSVIARLLDKIKL